MAAPVFYATHLYPLPLVRCNAARLDLLLRVVRRGGLEARANGLNGGAAADARVLGDGVADVVPVGVHCSQRRGETRGCKRSRGAGWTARHAHCSLLTGSPAA